MENKKQMLTKKRNLLVITSLIFVILFVSLVSAGVGFRKLVEVYPGETHIETLRLQNLDPEGVDMLFKGSITQGNEVVSFDKENEFNVPKEQIVDAPLKITAPVDAVIGDIYTIKITFRSEPLSSSPSGVSGGSSIQFIKANGISFDVKVVEKPQPPAEEVPAPEKFVIGTGWIILAIIVVIAIVAFILLRGKKKKK